MNRRLPVVTGPRYIHRFANGLWQVFDTVYYGVVDAKPTENAAEDRAAQLNARKEQSGPRRRA